MERLRFMHLRFVLAACVALLAAAGCASTNTTGVGIDAQRAALYRAHAGEPIDGFLGRINSWTSLDDTALVVWTGANRGYLLEVMGPCQELPWAHTITLSNGQFDRVSRFDELRVIGRGVAAIPCQIREIRPIDVKAVKEARKQAREAG